MRSPSSASIVQRADNPYVEERNKGDIAEAAKYFGGLKHYVRRTAETGPAGKFGLFEIDHSHLPEKVREVIQKVKAYDPPDDNLTGAEDLGFRYDIHSNRGGHLPESTLGAAPTPKQQHYSQFAQNWEKLDVKGNPAQYAEFHLTGSGLGKAFRILYDYVNDQVYISLSHYNIWQDSGADQSPFIRVLNIP